MEGKLLLRIPEAGARIGVGRSKAYELVASGELASVRLSQRSIRVPASALEAYVRRLEMEAGITDGEDLA
ncbi:MAG: helix-turn-helix transcriptional regulator [Thermoleophilia bacterium]